MTERPLSVDQKEVTKKVIPQRDQFGDGKGGDYAYQTVISDLKCKAIDPVSRKKCENDAMQTIDFDVFGQMECISNCGKSCAELIRKTVERDLAKHNQVTAFGKNGWGRERS